VKLKRGQYVRHSKYGWGTIMEYDVARTTVYFRTIGIKKLATSSNNFVMVGGESLKKKAVR